MVHGSLTPEQLSALGMSSRLDDSEVRQSDNATRKDAGVKAKIDHIEREMVGDTSHYRTSGRPAGFFDAPTAPAPIGRDASGSRPGELDALPALDAAAADDDLELRTLGQKTKLYLERPDRPFADREGRLHRLPRWYRHR